MLVGKILRSPHAHARILRINTDKAETVPGVKAVVTSADFPEIPPAEATKGSSPPNYRHLSQNLMAREKVLYDGHAVAAVAATSAAIATEALALIEVDYEILPHVTGVLEAMADEAPVLHEDLFTGGVDPKPEKSSNIAKRVEFAIGDTNAGFDAADVIVERDYDTEGIHQGYIEPHAVVASMGADRQANIWCSSQGHFMVRQYCAGLLNMSIGDIKVTPAEIGGGFGGKTTVYLEPVALLLSKKSGLPIKMVMTREEVFRGTGPTSGSYMTIKVGAKRDGTITAAEADLRFFCWCVSGRSGSSRLHVRLYPL
jgi:CO/xanthine dehydrogenase Mo-binding subunit